MRTLLNAGATIVGSFCATLTSFGGTSRSLVLLWNSLEERQPRETLRIFNLTDDSRTLVGH